jgi:hypothetical protein
MNIRQSSSPESTPESSPRLRYLLRFLFGTVLLLAFLVLPSTPPLFHKVERHVFRGHSGGFSTSGIHRWPHTSQTATRIIFHAMLPS